MWDSLAGEFTNGFSAVPWYIALTRLIFAAVLGAVIGYEREAKGKPAGLRTHILVAVAACLFSIVGQELSQLQFDSDDVKRVDPLRLIEAVTSGVAFLAAGLIFTSGGKVRNITTGASMWLAGAIGLACGAGEAMLGLMATLIVVIVLHVLGLTETASSNDTAE
ncbi:MgtC/SapB family protein [Loktanella sp. DJP18]|uniref:MgtC/SapB family protein n=1 Tax=Loktanella sp. DJP18 TaxID=3409788 RepID=UPI003BB51D79